MDLKFRLLKFTQKYYPFLITSYKAFRKADKRKLLYFTSVQMLAALSWLYAALRIFTEGFIFPFFQMNTILFNREEFLDVWTEAFIRSLNIITVWILLSLLCLIAVILEFFIRKHFKIPPKAPYNFAPGAPKAPRRPKSSKLKPRHNPCNYRFSAHPA